MFLRIQHYCLILSYCLFVTIYCALSKAFSIIFYFILQCFSFVCLFNLNLCIKGIRCYIAYLRETVGTRRQCRRSKFSLWIEHTLLLKYTLHFPSIYSFELNKHILFSNIFIKTHTFR